MPRRGQMGATTSDRDLFRIASRRESGVGNVCGRVALGIDSEQSMDRGKDGCNGLDIGLATAVSGASSITACDVDVEMFG